MGGRDKRAAIGSHGPHVEPCATEDVAYAIFAPGQPVLPVPKPLCAVGVELAAYTTGRPAAQVLCAVDTILHLVVLILSFVLQLRLASRRAVFSLSYNISPPPQGVALRSYYFVATLHPQLHAPSASLCSCLQAAHTAASVGFVSIYFIYSN